MTVSNLLERVHSASRSVVVLEDEPLDNVIKQMIEARDDRTVYVVSPDRRFRGVLSLGDLIRHYFAGGVYDQKSLNPATHILKFLTQDTAGDLMRRHCLVCHPDDALETVIRSMTHPTLIKVIPVLDENERVVASLDLLDVIALQHAKPG